MSGEKLRPGLIMVALIGVLTFLFFKSREHDVNKHHDITLTLQQLSHQDALLNEAVLQLRADRFSNYDSISQQSQTIQSLLTWLKSDAAQLYGQLGTDMDRTIKETEVQFNSKLALIERFKSYNGVLKNSMFYLPGAIENNQNDTTPAFINDKMNHLLREVLLFNAWPDEQNQEAATRYAQILEKTKVLAYVELATHANTIVKHRINIQSVIEELFSLPTAQMVEQIYTTYSEHNAEVAKKASRYRTAMYVMALLMLFYLLKLFGTLRYTLLRLELSLREVAFQKDALDEHAIVISVSPDGTLNYVNEKFTRTSLFSKDQVLGQPWNMLECDDESEGRAKAMWTTLAAGNCWTGEMKLRKNDGISYWADVTIVPFMDKDAKPIRYIALLTDITERKLNQERIYNLAHYDELTKLPNRGYFLENLEESINQTIHSNQRMAVLFLDLDNFKTINDTKGHACGDELLRTVGDHLRTCVRDNDMVSRLGGDEFTITLRDVQSLDDIKSVVDRIMALTQKTVRIDQDDISISTSVGIAMLPDDTSNKDTLLKYADIAMYKAKTDGKNNFRFFSKELRIENVHKHSVESELKTAIREQQFELYYQPKMLTRTGKITAVEALIRWNHPEKGLLPPELFLPALEESGLILPVGEWTLSTACAQLAQWKALGHDLRIAVNVSAHQVADKHLINLIHQLTERYPIKATDIELELTEATFQHNPDSAIAVFSALSETGAKLILDDFGTGFSSLSHLKKLPLDVLKIDRSFISGLPEDEHDKAIATTILAMAENMNLEVVAEGVETAEQLDFLKQSACQYVQGYYLCKPLPAVNLLQVLRENNEVGTDDRRTA